MGLRVKKHIQTGGFLQIVYSIHGLKNIKVLVKSHVNNLRVFVRNIV